MCSNMKLELNSRANKLFFLHLPLNVYESNKLSINREKDDENVINNVKYAKAPCKLCKL